MMCVYIQIITNQTDKGPDPARIPFSKVTKQTIMVNIINQLFTIGLGLWAPTEK